MSSPIWQTTRFRIDLTRPQVMGIVNVTPDSFSDGGLHDDTTSALRHCEALVKAGADILDIGGESTRPGAPVVSTHDELERVLPVLREALRLGVPVSVDTSKADVMRAALDEGADIINDVWALRQPEALGVVAGHSSCGICLMHMHREPQTMQALPMQGEVVDSVRDFLQERVNAACASGIGSARIAVDPGVGFGKTVDQNFTLLRRQADAVPPGYPVLVGWSRKSSLGAITGLSAPDRMVPSVTAAVLAVERGARIVRVHDVGPTVSALAVWRAMKTLGIAAPDSVRPTASC
jgi:dihydropteroate synthase